MVEREKYKKIDQDIAVISEIKTSTKLIRLGFGEIQNLDGSNDFYFLPFQLLSQGFERLLKSMICIGHFNEKGQYPDSRYIKKIGHDLEKLLSEVLSKYFNSEENEQLKRNKLFLSSDKELKNLLYILSEFGKFARYYNFDIITDSTKPAINAEALWGRFENNIMISKGVTISQMADPERASLVYQQIARHIVIILEKFVEALATQFVYGALGKKGQQFSYDLSDFAFLDESKYGKTDYRKVTTRYKKQDRKRHRRNIRDFFLRRFHPEYIYRYIKREDYDGEWPFYEHKVIIECRYRHRCIVSINGYDYALNGTAAGYYKLDLVHDAGVAIIGVSTDKFIQMTLALGEKCQTTLK